MQEWKSQQVQKKKLKKFKQQNGGITAQEGLEGKMGFWEEIQTRMGTEVSLDRQSTQ